MADLNLQNLQNAAFYLSCLFEAAGHVPQNFLQYLNCHRSHGTPDPVLELISCPWQWAFVYFAFDKTPKEKIQWG